MPAAAPQFVVVELRVDASNAQTGAAQYSSALSKAEQAANALTGAADKAQLAITSQSNAMVQAKAANDNLGSSIRAANDNIQGFGSSALQNVANFVSLVSQLKLVALGAYALSPAFRSFVNVGVSQSLALMGANAGVMATAVTRLISVASPLLALFARLTLPIAAVVAVMELLNAAWTQGSALVEKFTNSGRQFFGASVDSDLAKLTKFQNDNASLQQIQYATELGNRMDEAKQKINDVLKVQLDLTDVGLKLYNVWVLIVEVIASAAGTLGQVVSLIQRIPNFSGFASAAVNAIPGIGPLLNVLSAANGLMAGAPSGVSQDQALDLAKKKLAAAMGGGFAGRFTGDISALSSPKTDDASGTARGTAYDRQLQNIRDQVDLLGLEADGANKTTQAYQEMVVAHRLNIAAMRAGIEPTDAMRAEWKKLGDELADATLKLNQTKVLNEETFKGSTQFMSPSDAAAASAAHQIDPNNWAEHLNDAGPAMARFNTQLKTGSDLAFNFLDTFDQGLLRGQTKMQAFTSALQSLASTLIQMAEKNLVNMAFGGLFGSNNPTDVNNGYVPFIGGGGIVAKTGHSGALIGSWSSGSKYVHPAYFENAPRMHSGGMLGADERPFIGLTGERVLNRQETANYGKPIIVQPNVRIINNHSGAKVDQRTTDDGDIELTVRAITRDEMAGSRSNAIQRQKYGQQPRLRQLV